MKFILSQRTLTVLISLFFLLLYVNSKDAYSTYSTFDLITQDTVLVLKRYKNDILVDFDVKNQKIIQYSYDSGCLILTDLESSSTKVIEFLKNKSSKIYYPWNFQYNFLNDSTIAFYYESYDPIIDEKVGLININSGMVSHPFNLEFPFLLTEKNSISEKGKNFMKNGGNGVWLNPKNSKPPINSADTSFFISMIIGSSEIGKGPLRSNTPNIIKVTPKGSKIKSDVVKSYFSILNPIFKDSINKKLRDCMHPATTCYNKNNFLISFEGSKDVLNYNLERDELRKIEVDIPFLSNIDSVLNFRNRSMDDCYSFGNFYTHTDNSYMIRQINFPIPKIDQSKSNLKISRFLLLNKELECLGISNNFNKNYLMCGADQDYFYALDIVNSISDPNYNHIIKLKIENIKSHTNNYKVGHNEQTVSIAKKFTSYLNSISDTLIKSDTIVLVFTTNVCPKCIRKTSVFLNEMEKAKIQSRHPVLIISTDREAENAFLSGSNIKKKNPYYFENKNGFFIQIGVEKGMGYLYRSKDGYNMSTFDGNKIDDFLKFVHPKVNKIGDFCFPLK